MRWSQQISFFSLTLTFSGCQLSFKNFPIFIVFSLIFGRDCFNLFPQLLFFWDQNEPGAQPILLIREEFPSDVYSSFPYSCSVLIFGSPVFFIPAAPCLTLRHHFPHPEKHPLTEENNISTTTMGVLPSHCDHSIILSSGKHCWRKNIHCHHFVIASHCFLWKLQVVTLLQGMTANHHHTRSDTAVKGHFEKRKTDFSQHFSSSKDLEGVYLAHGGVCLAWRLAGRHLHWVPWDWPVAANQRVKKSNKYL